MAPCEHTDFEASVVVRQVEVPPHGTPHYDVHLQVRCAAADCDAELVFQGLSQRMQGLYQMVSSGRDGRVAHLTALLSQTVEHPDPQWQPARMVHPPPPAPVADPEGVETPEDPEA